VKFVEGEISAER